MLGLDESVFLGEGDGWDLGAGDGEDVGWVFGVGNDHTQGEFPVGLEGEVGREEPGRHGWDSGKD